MLQTAVCHNNCMTRVGRRLTQTPYKIASCCRAFESPAVASHPLRVSNADRYPQLRNKLHHQLREIPKIRHQIEPETFERNLPGRENQHHA